MLRETAHVVPKLHHHYNDVVKGVMASQITCVSIVYSTVCSGADQREHQSSASLAFARGIHQWRHKRPVTRKRFPFDDIIKHYICIWTSLPALDCLLFSWKCYWNKEYIYVPNWTFVKRVHLRIPLIKGQNVFLCHDLSQTETVSYHPPKDESHVPCTERIVSSATFS